MAAAYIRKAGVWLLLDPPSLYCVGSSIHTCLCPQVWLLLTRHTTHGSSQGFRERKKSGGTDGDDDYLTQHVFKA